MRLKEIDDICIDRTAEGDVAMIVDTGIDDKPVKAFTISEEQARYLFSQSGKVLSKSRGASTDDDTEN